MGRRAAVGGQPSFSAMAGSLSTEPRGGALPRSIERSCHCLLHAMRMNSIDQSGFFAYFDTARKWPSIQVRLWLLSAYPGTVSANQFPPVFESAGSFINVI
jgi:hypothetical protein